MPDNTQGNITGKLTADEIAADARANAEQDTRPNLAVETGIRKLREIAKQKRR